ncbi:hypothetical protein AWV80_20095 [Cupriavidus sp. UYMU48A]|nr:hypothetical protein AWV80_20095 [Cupriavidus sp. UYMU48A]
MHRFTSRRLAPACLAVAALLAATGAVHAQSAQGGKIKVGFMLPYTGTYAALGTAIENGFRMYVQQQARTSA